MLAAQHNDATTTSSVTTEAAGATMLVPNAMTRAGPITPRASPLVSFMPTPPSRSTPLSPDARSCHLTRHETVAEHGTADRSGGTVGHGRHRRASAGRPGARRLAGVRRCRVEAPASPGAARDGPPGAANRQAGAGGLPPGRLGGRAARLREDDAFVAVGRARRQGLRVGVGGREGQRPEGPAQLRGGGIARGAAGGRAGVRCAGLPQELGPRFRGAAAGVGVLVDDHAGRAGAGRRAPAAQPRVPGRAVGAGRSRAAGSRLALAGRSEPPLRVARLRAEGRILEIGPADLSLTREEAASLLRQAEVALAADEVAALHQRTEGWPVGLYLAALYLREGGSLGGAAVSFGGGDRLVSEYMESEFLATISRRYRVFLTRTAVLERMSGSLCEAVLDLPGSAVALAELARSNLLLVPLDRRGVWYRYHHLFRDMLLAELERLEPGLMPVLRRRAAAWCVDNGRAEEALEYAIAAGDAELAVRLAQDLFRPTYRQGRVATLQRWLRWLESRGVLGRYPSAAVWAALLAMQTGRPAEAERWADVVDRWQYGAGARPDDPAAEAWAAILRAVLCRGGVDQMRADADEAVHRCAASGIVAPVVALCQGIARVMSGDPAGADASFADATGDGEAGWEVGAPDVLAEILSERSLLAMARGAWSQAEALAGQAGAVLRDAGIEDPLACAVQARMAAHRGEAAAARRELVRAQRLRSLLTYAQPHLAVQVRIELARVHLALADAAGARTLLREIDEVLRRRPGLGTLAGEAGELRARLAAERAPGAPGASSLTAAELRVLPMLATHLSFPEIGAEVFLSPHTIKSQAMSVYRKLGASSRSQAVARARELGLLEG